jgi:N-carbamoylputrescine amidase
MICFDREFPESARMLMLKGAELILTPNACELEANRLGQFRARAFENMVGVAMANYAAPHNNGHSVAYDPVVYDARGNARDTLIVEAGEDEGIYLAPFDIDRIRAYRTRET